MLVKLMLPRSIVETDAWHEYMTTLVRVPTRETIKNSFVIVRYIQKHRSMDFIHVHSISMFLMAYARIRSEN